MLGLFDTDARTQRLDRRTDLSAFMNEAKCNIVIGGKEYPVSNISLGGVHVKDTPAGKSAGDTVAFKLLLKTRHHALASEGTAQVMRRDEEGVALHFHQPSQKLMMDISHFLASTRL